MANLPRLEMVAENINDALYKLKGDEGAAAKYGDILDDLQLANDGIQLYHCITWCHMVYIEHGSP